MFLLGFVCGVTVTIAIFVVAIYKNLPSDRF